MIEPKEKERCCTRRERSDRKKTKDEVVSIEGKRVWGSGGSESEAIEMVSAWGKGNQIYKNHIQIHKRRCTKGTGDWRKE